MARDQRERRDRGGRGGRQGNPYRGRRRKRCRLCMAQVKFVDYKNVEMLRNFTTERGKIITRRISGNCAKHQRQITRAVNRARNIVLLPFTRQQ